MPSFRDLRREAVRRLSSDRFLQLLSFGLAIGLIAFSEGINVQLAELVKMPLRQMWRRTELRTELQADNLTRDSQDGHRWGVILAGGDGRRLLPFTQKITGDDRPKQFCNVMGRETLLSRTRNRVSRMVRPEHTLVAVTKTHERFYINEAPAVSPASLLVQPENKGTAPAIAYSLLRVHNADPNALVAFFPADHHFSNEEALNLHIDSAYALAAFQPELVILLGITPDGPESGYGWIEPGPALSHPLPLRARRVTRFWEKPSEAMASTLIERGCLWNSFVMIGHVRAFSNLIRRTLPELLASIQALRPSLDTGAAEIAMADLYGEIPTIDFAREVLSTRPDDLAVLCGFGLGWSDLGEPHRVVAALERDGYTKA